MYYSLPGLIHFEVKYQTLHSELPTLLHTCNNDTLLTLNGRSVSTGRSTGLTRVQWYSNEYHHNYHGILSEAQTPAYSLYPGSPSHLKAWTKACFEAENLGLVEGVGHLTSLTQKHPHIHTLTQSHTHTHLSAAGYLPWAAGPLVPAVSSWPPPASPSWPYSPPAAGEPHEYAPPLAPTGEGGGDGVCVYRIACMGSWFSVQVYIISGLHLKGTVTTWYKPLKRISLPIQKLSFQTTECQATGHS